MNDRGKKQKGIEAYRQKAQRQRVMDNPEVPGAKRMRLRLRLRRFYEMFKR